LTGADTAFSGSEAILREAARSYPHEGGGALLGRAEGEVSETLALPNEEA
jgi:hypothetical protein